MHLELHPRKQTAGNYWMMILLLYLEGGVRNASGFPADTFGTEPEKLFVPFC